jgi:hypothetical protein
VNLKTTTPVIKEQDGKCYLTSTISNPAASKTIAFGIRVQAIKAGNGEQILPSIMNDNYFSLLPGERKEIKIEFKKVDLGMDKALLKVEPYNNTHP